jgi:hypothetical protein
VVGESIATDIGGDEDIIVTDCAIPEGLKKHARNDDGNAKLLVSVSHDDRRSFEQPSDTWDNIPVCANHIVNGAQLLDGTKPKHDLAACVMVTGDPYWSAQNQWLVGSVERRMWEWFEFHIMVGIQHFYVYDNSEEPYGHMWHELKHLVDAGLISYGT